MPIIEVKKLTRQIANAERRIKQIEKECKHRRILHIEKPDEYCGWGISDECLMCGKMISVASTPVLGGPRLKPVRKVIGNSPRNTSLLDWIRRNNEA